MATSDQNGSGRGSRGRTDRNNNPEGRNQYSGLAGAARANPIRAAAAVGSAVAAGVFLWSRRNQLSEQIESLSDQVKEWRASSEGDFTGENLADVETSRNSTARSGSRGRSQVEIAEEALALKEAGASK